MRRITLIVVILLLISACGTTDTTLRDAGRSEAYVTGFHDGRHSGMQEAGNEWEHYIRDEQRFASDEEYQAGWLAGEAEGKRMQAQAKAVGEAAAGAYSGYRVSEEADKAGPHPEKAAKEAMKGVDTDALKSLEK